MTIHFATLPKGFDLPPGLTLRPAKAARKPGTASKPRRRAKPPAKAPEPLEREIQAAILGYLWTIPRSWWCRYNSAAVKNAKTGSFFRANSRPGHPDLGGAIDGHAVYVEVKRPGKEPTEQQEQCLDELRRAGAVVIVARCVEDVRTVLEKEGLL